MDDSVVCKKRLEWMTCDDRLDDLYVNGVKEFLDFAFSELATSSDLEEGDKKVPCPCNRCNNSRHKSRKEIYYDLILHGIVRGYVRWIYHGEYKQPHKRSRTDFGDGNADDIFRMIHEACGVSNDDADDRYDDE
ncbi:hypothetical protein M5689_011118 [Euphorbia peplus]|nr:hypothetical protein M5689_011118 [Euphorbia peplus]